MKLLPHQEEALQLTKDRSRCAYYYDMGLGKTFIGSEKAIELNKNILVICQKSMIKMWIKHFLDNYTDDRGYKWLPYDLTNKKGMTEFMLDTELIHCIGVINYDTARNRPELFMLKDFTLMLDESSIIQNTKTKTWKFISKLNFSNVILLSGTPCSGKYENLWSQGHLLGWDIDEKTFLKHYINYKKVQTDIGIKKVIDKENPYKNQERLRDKFRSFGALFKKTEEVYGLDDGLPPQMPPINIDVKPPKEYKKFMEGSYIRMGDVELVGNTTLTKSLYARQLCSQYNKAKIEAFEDLINSTNDRLIVFYNFTKEFEILKEHVNDRPISIVNGNTKDLTAYENEDDSITFIQYQAGSKGLNLQKANKIIYFSPTPSVENWMQSQKRIHRIGQERVCFYYKLVSGVDYRIYDNLAMGKDFTDDLFKKEEDDYRRRKYRRCT